LTSGTSAASIDLKHAKAAVLNRLLRLGRRLHHRFPLPVRALAHRPAHVLPLNPRLIYASFTAYGEVGDDAANRVRLHAYWARG
jgi:hypothetical protein